MVGQRGCYFVTVFFFTKIVKSNIADYNRFTKANKESEESKHTILYKGITLILATKHTCGCVYTDFLYYLLVISYVCELFSFNISSKPCLFARHVLIIRSSIK